MAQITLVFNPDFSKVQAAVENLKTELKNISLDEKGLKTLTAYNNSVAKLAKTENELTIATEKTTQAEARRDAQREKTKTTEKAVELQMEKTATAEEQARKANTQRLTEIQRENTVLARKQLEEAKTATAAERTANTEAKAALETKKRETAEAQLALQQEKTATVTARAEAAQARQNTVLKEGSAASTLMNNSLGSLVLQYVSLRTIINKVVSAFRDALGTMKEVDSALVTIQKTTGFSKDQLDEVTKAAYELASAYGRTASEILDAASVYARAGFKDNLADMTELSALLQNVGDLSGETAAKFLVATNAAWKLDGSYDELLRVIDGLNEQTNQAAVDMEALTSGITVAGSVFANAGESVQTFAGLLGTGVAVTQRSGAEIARGLRTILMNVRQIKGELEDGEIIDETTISDAAAALHSVGISVADTNGELRLTSDVLGELAGKWDSLTSAEQSYLAQSLAGKRQANVLTALMQNWEEAQRQMTLYANGAGSAMKENEIYLNSWEAKTKQLNAAWTEFVANLVDTDTIKAALDGVIKLVDLLDSDIGRTVVTVGALGTAAVGLVSIFGKIAASMAAIGVSMGPFLIAIAAISGIVIAADALTTTTREYAEAAKEAENSYANIKSQVESLKSRAEELTAAERQKLELLQKQEEIEERRMKRAKMDLYNSMYGNRDALTTANDLIAQYQAYQRRIDTTEDLEELEKLEEGLDNVYDSILTTMSVLFDFKEVLGDELPESADAAANTLSNFITYLDGGEAAVLAAKAATEEATDAVNEAGDALETTGEKAAAVRSKMEQLRDHLQLVSDAADKLDAAVGSVTSAMESYGAESVQVYDAMTALEQAIPGSTAKIYDFDTATVTTKEDIFGSKEALLDFIDTTKQLEFSQQINELEALAASYMDVAGAALEAMANQEAAAQMANVLSFTTTGSQASDINAQIEAIRKERDEWNAAISALRARTPYSGGSGGGGGGSSGSGGSTTITDEELNRLKSIVNLRKQELSFLEASGAENDAIVAKYKEIQASLHDQAEYLRQSLNTLIEEGGKESEINALTQQITALSTEWWNIQKKIAQATGEIVDELEDAENAEERIVNRWSEKGYLTGRQVREQGGVIEGEGDEDDYSRSGTSTGSGIADTTDHVLEALQKTVALRKAELNYLQASGAEYAVIAAKQREIQEALLRQADYMKSIGADEAEILALGTEWWNIQNSIIDTLKKKQEELFDQIKKTVDEYYDKIVNDKKEELEYEEKILAVQQAQAALANAQAERTVRYWNASTGQWEWAANAKNVKSAQDSLKKAQESLNDYQKDQAWKEFKTAWEYVAQQIKDGSMTFRAAYDYMLEETKKISDQYGVDMTDILRESLGKFASMDFGISGLTQDIADLIGGSVGNLKTSLTDFENVLKQLISSTGIAAQGIGKSILDLLGIGSSGVGGKSRLNPQDLVPSSVPDAGKRELIQLEEAANAPPKWSGRYGGSNPYLDPMRWTDPEKWAAYSKLMEADPEYVAKLTALSDAINRGDATKEELDALYNSLYSSKEGSSGYFGAYQDENGTTGFVKAGYGNANGEHLLIINGQLYEGGVDPGTMLQDLWGNRWVVGLDGHSLAPIDRAWDAEMMDMENNDLSIMGADGELEADQGPLPEPVNNIGTQNNGDTYNLGGVTISEGDAKTMTVFDFVELSAKLGQFNGR